MNQDFLNSSFKKLFDPPVQAGLILLMGLLIVGCAKLLDSMGISEMGTKFPWLISASLLLFFAIMNSVVSLSDSTVEYYWMKSIFSFAGLAFLSGMAATWFSSISVYAAGSYSWIYVVVSIGYVVFISIMNLMRTIVNIAIKQDKKLRNEE